METIVQGVITAAIIGLFTTAWTQPSLYNMVVLKVLIGGSLAAMIIGQAWDLSASFALKKASELLPQLKDVSTTVALDAAQIPSHWWIWLILFALYGVGLSFFATWMSSHHSGSGH